MRKKLLLWLFLLAALPSVFAANDVVEIHLQEAGTLASKLEEAGMNVKTITDLKVTGSVNQEDFRVMSKIMTALMYLDLSRTDLIAIPENAFDGKGTLQKCIVPEGLQSIGGYAFRYCSALINQPFGQKITSIGNNAFEGCNKIKGDIVFPESLTSLGDGAFQNCDMLTSVDMSKYKGYQVPNYIFQSCSSLNKVILPISGGGTITGGGTYSNYSIGWSAFYGTAITEITIPEAVYNIQYNAFGYCNQLRTINMRSSTPPTIEESTFSGVNKSSCTLNVPVGSLKTYSYASHWSAFPTIEEIGIQAEIGTNGSVLCSGAILKNGEVVFHQSQQTTFTLLPNPGYVVDKAWFNKQEIAITGNTVKVGAGVKSGTLKVSFILKKFNLNVTAQGNGKLKFNDEFLAAQQTMLVDSASSVQFALLPDEGYAVKSILYNNEEGVAQQNQSVYTTPFAEKDANLIVTFASKAEIGDVQKFSIRVGTHGNVLYKNTPLLAESDVVIKKGETAAFKIVPDKYYMIGKVLYNQKDVTASVSKEGVFTTEAVDADGVLEVSFVLSPVITVNVEQAGTLKKLLTEEQLQIVTHLTLTGKISEIDFTTMRDDMPVLSVIDMSKAITSLEGAMMGLNYIPSNAFSTGSYESTVGKKTLTEVKLPVNVTAIGSWAFANCMNLKSVNFEECTGLISIENDVFRGTALASVDLSKTKIISLTSNQFSRCSQLTEVLFPSTLASLSYAFGESAIKVLDLSVCEGLTSLENLNCQSLESMKLPVNLETIGNSAFSNTKLKSIDLSVCAKLKRINSGAFQSNQYLQEVKFPASLEVIDNWAFNGCRLTSLDLSGCTLLSTINESVFSNNSTLKSLKLPANLSSIGRGAFSGCNISEKLEFPASLSSIGEYAFGSCGISGILELPASITSIGENAFSSNNITICKIAAVVPPTLGNNVFGGDPMMGAASSLVAVFVPEASIKAYKNASGWSEYTILGGENRVDVTVTKPGNLAVDIMEQAEISPASVTHLVVHGKLNNTDFGVMRSNMTVLYSLDLSDADAEIIPQEAFRDKKILMEFKAPKNLSIIESQAFSGCTSLAGVIELPGGVTTIGDRAFANCQSMTGIKFSDSLLKIGSEAFSGCIGLSQEITFPSKLRTIEWGAFSGCNSLFGTLTLPASLESLGYNAFQSCAKLQKVDMSACASLTEIPGQAFSNCSELEEVLFPEKVQYIRDNAFSSCVRLNNLKFPANLYSIDGSAFNNCTSLTTVDLSSCTMLNSIGGYTFSNCISLATLNLPASLTNIGAYAFSQCRALANINAANAVPAQLGDYVFQRVNTEVCILSIPTNSFNDYLTAQQWGAFVQLRKAIEVNMNDEGGNMQYANNASVEDEEDENVMTQTICKANAQVSATQKGAIATNGSSIYVKKNETVSFFITPKTGYAIYKVMYNDKEVTSEVQNGVYTTPKVVDKANLKVSFGSAVPATGISLNKTAITLAVSKSETLIATVTPEEHVNKLVTWTSSNPEIATVDANGLVTALKVGVAKITATTIEGGFTAVCDVTVLQPATGVVLNKKALTLKVSGSETLIATVSPELASDKSVTWTSNNPEVATVDVNGLVTAIKVGTAQITVTTVDGGFTATCAVTVLQPATGVSLNKNTLTLKVSGSETLIATVAPELASDKSVTWTSSNPEIATVGANGLVTAIKVGTAQITVITVDGGFTATCAVTVLQPATGVSLNKNTLTLKVSGTETLIATVAPELASDKSVTWTSSNPEVATVDVNGLVTAIKVGTAQITVTTVDGGFTATCDVTVLQPATGVSLNKNTLTLKETETETLIATVAPELASDKSVTWTSSNPEVATVDANGLVTAIKVGIAQITVTTVDGGFTAICDITVNPISGITSSVVDFKVQVNNNTLTISGVEEGRSVSIYSISGVLISTIISEGMDITVSLPVNAIYVIRTNHAKPVKIVL